MSNNNSYFLIVNPASDTGRLKKKWPEVLEHIQENYDVKFDWAFTEGISMAEKLVVKAVEDGYSVIVSVGGDGIANEIINSIMKNDYVSKVVMGVLALGTSNDIHRGYKIPFDYKEGVRVLFENHVIKVPVGKITGDFGSGAYYFLNHADTGLATLATKSALNGFKWLKGEVKYYFYAMGNILKFKENIGTVKLDGEYVLNEAGEKYDHFSMIAWSFTELLGGFKLFPGNNMQQEGFEVLVGGYRSRLGLLKLLLQAGKGNHKGKPDIVLKRANTVEIEFERVGWPFQGEGEIFTEECKYIKAEYVKDAIDMIVPAGVTVF